MGPPKVKADSRITPIVQNKEKRRMKEINMKQFVVLGMAIISMNDM